jgi:glycine C-acetyltransferase
LALVAHLRRRGILATGLGYPVVSKGDEEIRFQISADHTRADINAALDALARFLRKAPWASSTRGRLSLGQVLKL